MFWFADVTGGAGIDTQGAYSVTSTNVGASHATFGVEVRSFRGSPTVLDLIECQIYPQVDISSKADITYVDAQDEFIKENWLKTWTLAWES